MLRDKGSPRSATREHPHSSKDPSQPRVNQTNEKAVREWTHHSHDFTSHRPTLALRGQHKQLPMLKVQWASLTRKVSWQKVVSYFVREIGADSQLFLSGPPLSHPLVPRVWSRPLWTHTLENSAVVCELKLHCWVHILKLRFLNCFIRSLVGYMGLQGV